MTLYGPIEGVLVVEFVVVEVVVVVVSGEPLLDVLTTQLWVKPELDVQSVVDPALTLLLEHTGALPSVALQLSLELLLDAADPELVLLVLEVHVVVVPVPDVTTVHPAGRLNELGVLPELVELDDPPLLKLEDPPLLDPPRLELDDPPPLELDDPLPELLELLLEELYEPWLPDTEPSSARATCVDDAEPRTLGSAVAPASSRTAAGRAISRVGRIFMRYLAIKPFRGSVKTPSVYWRLVQ